MADIKVIQLYLIRMQMFDLAYLEMMRLVVGVSETLVIIVWHYI